MKGFCLLLIVFLVATVLLAHPKHAEGQRSENKIATPLKQLKAGIEAKDVKCIQDLLLVIKGDGSPACVRNTTASILIDRGWARQIVQTSEEGKASTNVHAGDNLASSASGPTGTVELQNVVYDSLALNSTMMAYHSPPLQATLDGIDFTLLPGPFSGGPPGGCGGTPFRAEARYGDGTYLQLDVFVAQQPCAMNLTKTSLGWHKGSGVGLTVIGNNVVLLVSKGNLDPRTSQMDLEAYGFVCCGMAGDLLRGNLSSIAGPIPGANVTISVNGILMGIAKTLPDGCFQFNQWNESRLSDQTGAFKASEQASGTFTPFPLEFSAQYGGNGTRHYPAEAHAESSMSLYALPLPPPQMQSTVTPPEVNITQGSSATVRISIKPMVEQWDVTHLNPYLDRLPCGITYEMVQVSDNDTSSTTHPAVFDFVLKAASYSQEGRYYVGVEQNGTNNQVDREVGTFILNTLKTK